MNRTDLSLRTRSLVRDLTNTFFRESDINNYLNEGIDRVKQIIPELEMIPHLTSPTQEVLYFPPAYHHLLAVYCASRLCTQDERHYQAGTFMNEFETKLASLKELLYNGELSIKDPDTDEVIEIFCSDEYVKNNYYYNNHGVIKRRG